MVHLAPAFGGAAETICVVAKVAITTQLAMTVRALNLRTDSIEQIITQKVHLKYPKRNQIKWWALRDLNPDPLLVRVTNATNPGPLKKRAKGYSVTRRPRIYLLIVRIGVTAIEM